MPDGTPIESGLISFRRRLFNILGYNVVIIHKSQWEDLKVHEKEQQLMAILSNFPPLQGEEYVSDPKPLEFVEDKDLRHYKHLRPKITTWPPEKIVV
ncbi:RAP domain [Babesia duncani]|uniref:RAP domain n=1 Tax=Babesia duncani TaxID=323732 RepID=A0AAD9PMD7_9APIC|nr:RAP domain [Babesia duncani]